MKWTDSEIGYSGAIKISELLMMNTTLTDLNLYGVIEKGKTNVIEWNWRNEWKYEIMIKRIGNEIGAEGASKISESLMVNTTLTTLDLGGV